MAKKPQYFAAAQMSNKAVGYMAAGSMAHQEGMADFEAQKKAALDKIKKNKQARENQIMTARQKTELDSLNLVAQGQSRKAQELYGKKFTAHRDENSTGIDKFSEEGKMKYSQFYNNQ
jgi:hypothetical protein